jgi:sporulation protein YlmC with PRC-barrel domain
MKKAGFCALIVALSLGLAAANVLAGEPMAQSWGKAYSFDQINRMMVKNPQGEVLGRIQDIVIDSQGHVPFAVVNHGGYLGMGGKLVAVPFGALSFDAMGKYLVLNAAKEKLDSAPAFKMSDLAEQKWAEDTYRFFGQQPYWTEGGGPVPAGSMGSTSEGSDFEDSGY